MRIKKTMLYHLTNMGQPFIYVLDGNYYNRGELFMAHKHNGLDMEIRTPDTGLLQNKDANQRVGKLA